MIIQDDTLKLVGDELTTEPYGAGVQEGDTEFEKFVNEVLDECKQDGALGRGLPEVGRAVHGRGAGAADHDAPGGDRARR